MGNSTQGNLLDPGSTPHDNLQFLLFCAAVIRGVHRYGPLLRAVVATAGNDHRLGANEAPPAIISMYLGKQLEEVFQQFLIFSVVPSFDIIRRDCCDVVTRYSAALITNKVRLASDQLAPICQGGVAGEKWSDAKTADVAVMDWAETSLCGIDQERIATFHTGLREVFASNTQEPNKTKTNKNKKKRQSRSLRLKMLCTSPASENISFPAVRLKSTWTL